MFEVFVYIVVTVVVLAFCGQSKQHVIFDIPDPTRIAELELLDELLAACNTPTRYEASEMPSDVCLVIPASEFAQAIDRAKRHDVNCMTAVEVRELCREHGIPVSNRGRIAQAVLDQLAAVL